MVADMRRLLIDASAVQENIIVLRDAAEINHVKNVMRMDVGDEITISDNYTFDYRTRIRSLNAGEILFEILEKLPHTTEPSYQITLFQGVPKQGKLEEIIQKSVELGVFCVVPVSMSRSLPKAGSVSAKIDRYRRVALEAAKQCGRGIVPEVEDEISFAALPNALRAYDLILFPYEQERGCTLREILCATGNSIALIIGPEGGFSETEAAALTAAGAQTCSLGARILRTETAGPAALAMLLYELEL